MSIIHKLSSKSELSMLETLGLKAKAIGLAQDFDKGLEKELLLPRLNLELLEDLVHLKAA